MIRGGSERGPPAAAGDFLFKRGVRGEACVCSASLQLGAESENAGEIQSGAKRLNQEKLRRKSSLRERGSQGGLSSTQETIGAKGALQKKKKTSSSGQLLSKKKAQKKSLPKVFRRGWGCFKKTPWGGTQYRNLEKKLVHRTHSGNPTKEQGLWRAIFKKKKKPRGRNCRWWEARCQIPKEGVCARSGEGPGLKDPHVAGKRPAEKKDVPRTY